MGIGAALISIGIVLALTALAAMFMVTPFGWAFGLGALVVATFTAVFCSRAVVENDHQTRHRDPFRTQALD